MNNEIIVTNDWHENEINEEFSTLTITIPIPKHVIDKLKEYGYDFTTNLTESLKECYWAICEAEDETKEKADN